MSDSLTADEISESISVGRVQMSILLVALVLAVYDMLLSLSQESGNIWRRRFSMMTILYATIRYGTVISMLLQVVSHQYIARSVLSCKVILFANYTANILCLISYAAFDCFRIWVINKFKWPPLILVFLTSMFPPAINIYIYSAPTITYSIISTGPFQGCQIMLVSKWKVCSIPIITQAIAVGSDALILFFTLMGTLSTYKESKNIQVKTKLTTALVQNGLLQFLVLLAMNITTMVLDQLSVASDSLILRNASYFLYVQDVINSILLSHFITNLRSKSPLNGNISQPSRLTSTTVEFASASILGDIGEPLNDSYGLGIADVDCHNVMGSTLPMDGDDSLLYDNTANDITEVIALCEIDTA